MCIEKIETIVDFIGIIFWAIMFSITVIIIFRLIVYFITVIIAIKDLVRRINCAHCEYWVSQLTLKARCDRCNKDLGFFGHLPKDKHEEIK